MRMSQQRHTNRRPGPRQTARGERILSVAAALVLLSAPIFAHAQPVVPPAAVEQFQHVIGSRVEAVTILGGDYGAGGGITPSAAAKSPT